MINPRTDKIAAIKAIRQFTVDNFGFAAGLLVSKTFIDAVNVETDQEEARQHAAALGKVPDATIRAYLEKKGYQIIPPSW